MLFRSDDFDVVDEGEDGQEVERIVREHRPDVVLMDINMPGIDGVEATRRLIDISPETKVLILSIHDDENYVTHALQSGASGYLLKEMDADSLVEAVRVVADGGAYIHPKVTHNLIAEFRKLAEKNGKRSSTGYEEVEYRKPLHILTRRECEVLQLIADGKSNRGVGEVLYISEKTVKNHVSNILQKMGVEDRTQAVVQAIKNGWVRVK